MNHQCDALTITTEPSLNSWGRGWGAGGVGWGGNPSRLSSLEQQRQASPSAQLLSIFVFRTKESGKAETLHGMCASVCPSVCM